MGNKLDKILRETAESGEPIFVLRAKDACALNAIGSYIVDCTEKGCNSDFIDDIICFSNEFEDWQNKNLDKVRIPD